MQQKWKTWLSRRPISTLFPFTDVKVGDSEATATKEQYRAWTQSSDSSGREVVRK